MLTLFTLAHLSLVSALGATSIGPSTSADAASIVHRQSSRGTGTFAWIENRGQWATPARFVARLPGMVVGVESRALDFQLFDEPTDPSHGVFVRFVFEGANEPSSMVGERPGDARYSWFVGNDRSHWQEGLRAHAAVRIRDLYEGVDLVVREDHETPKYDLEVAPGADLSQVRVRCEGVEGLQVDGQGFLVALTAHGCFTQPPIVAMQVRSNGSLREHSCRFRVIDSHTFGFEADPLEPGATLWIDPSLLWSTYFGGGGVSGLEWAQGVKVAANGDVYVVGKAGSLGFPATPGSFQHQSGVGDDCYAARFRGTDGALMYSSVFGGTDYQERAIAVDVDSQGRAFVAGTTNSLDFPVTAGAWNTSYQSQARYGFVLRLSSLGDQLDWSTFVGGVLTPVDITAIALDPNECPIIVGQTAPGFPTTPGCFDPIGNAFGPGFITKLRTDGSGVVWSTYFGGTYGGRVQCIDVDENGVITIGGSSEVSSNFPTTPGAYSRVNHGQTDAYVAKLRPDGSSLIWSTLYGGLREEYVVNVTSLRDGTVVFSGSTGSYNLPLTPNAMTSQVTGTFAARLTADGSGLVYSTYIGAGGMLDGGGMTADSSGIATIIAAGGAGAAMTPGSFSPTSAGNFETLLFRLNPLGTKVYYSTYLGGNGSDYPSAVDTSATGRTTVVGGTQSSNYPTTPGALQPTPPGGAFITTFEPYLQGVTPFGVSTPSCHHPLVANVTEQPRPNAAGFGLVLSNAPTSRPGLLFISTAAIAQGAPFLNATLWLAPATIVRRLPIHTDELGFVEVPLPLGPIPVGRVLWAQFAVRNDDDCPLGARVTTSNALRIEIQ